MLLNNYAVRNANQSRALGGNTDPTYQFSLSRMNTFYVGDNRVVSVTDRTSLPAQGLRPPYSLVLAPKAGGMSMWNGGTGSATGTGVAGLFGTSTIAGVGTISDAAMGLTVQMIAALSGSATVTAAIIGNLQAVATLAGTGSVSTVVGALAGLVATIASTGTVTDADATALGEMTANIYVNQSEATVAQIVDAVWNALAAEYNLTGTMGEAMNGAGSAGNPWITDLSSYNTANTAGKILKDRLSKGQFIALK